MRTINLPVNASHPGSEDDSAHTVMSSPCSVSAAVIVIARVEQSGTKHLFKCPVENVFFFFNV